MNLQTELIRLACVAALVTMMGAGCRDTSRSAAAPPPKVAHTVMPTEAPNEAPGAKEAGSSALVPARAALSEAEKIDRLLAAVRGLDGATFIRNGTEHTAAEAADHLAEKRSRAGDRIASANDFIEQLASRSSITGRPYMLRLTDGREVESGVWLHEQLKAIVAAAATGD